MTGVKYRHTLKTRPKAYARKKGFRKGSPAYNRYVHGTISRAIARKRRKRR